MSPNTYAVMFLLGLLCVAVLAIVYLLDRSVARGDVHRSRTRREHLNLTRMIVVERNRRRGE